MPDTDWEEPLKDTRTVQEKLEHIDSLDWWRDMELRARIAEEEERRLEAEELERQRLQWLAEEGRIQKEHENWPRGSGSVRRRRSCRRG